MWGNRDRASLIAMALGLMAACAAGLGKPPSQEDPALCTPIEAGTLFLDGGIRRLSYWPVAYDGRMQAWMADGIFQARLFMAQHDGDWCRFRLRLEDGATFVLDSATTIVLVLANADSVASTEILAPDSPFDIQFWKATDSPLVFKNGECPYGRTFTTRDYILYVRFPENSCLSGKTDDRYRRFRSQPVTMQVRRQ